MVTHLDHVQLAMPVGREADARAFYGQLLGMRELDKPDALRTRGGCWFASGGVQLHLGVDKDFAAATKAHPALCVDDIDALAVALTAASCRVEWDDAVPGRRRFYTADPFGNRVEFIREGDGFTQR